jgi:sorting nexin-1/2
MMEATTAQTTPSSNGSSSRWSVFVSNPTNEGTGRNMSTTYCVSTEKTSVRRRYSDFTWLYDRLMMEYPGAVVPIIPHKMALNSKFTPEFIEGRRKNLQKFLTAILEHVELHSAPSMTPFMTVPLDRLDDAKKAVEAANPNSLDPTGSAGSDDHLEEHFADKSASTSGGGSVTAAKKGLTNMFAKVVTLTKVTTGNVELEETKEDPEINVMREYLQEVDTHVKQLVTASHVLVKATNDHWTGIHTLGVPFAGWKQSHLNHIDKDKGSYTGSSVNQMTAIVDLSDELAGLKEKQHCEEQTTLELAMEQLQLDVRAFHLALKKRRELQVNYTTKVNQIKDKETVIDKHRKALKNPEKLEHEKSDLEKEATRLKDRLEDASARVIREATRVQPQLENSLISIITSYAQLQIVYSQKVSKAWAAVLPKLGAKPVAADDDLISALEDPQLSVGPAEMAVESSKKPTISSV